MTTAKVGQRVAVNVTSEHNGEPIVFQLEGTIVERHGEKFIRLDNGLEAPLSAATMEGAGR
jgi:hypothetical protein